jgi:7,8-dihydropterin-6-yl-methyl-4-(beta-D-ribofuranosyl)aminobenzene 5'-phosphate synthase
MSTEDTSIAIIVDNKAGPGLASEHGFSLWIQTEGKNILCDTGQVGDTGQTSALEANARALGVDLSRTDILVLSHGHYDHTGGIAHLLQRAGDVEVYCHPAVTRPRYVIRDGKATGIGMPPESAAALARLPSQRLHWVQGPVMLTPRVGLTGPIPRRTSYEDTGGPFFLDVAGEQHDPIEDDLALWINTDKGLVVCLGCCHAGLVNTLDYVARLTDGARVRAVIGGLHLMNAGRERLALTIAELERIAPELVVACHCSGEAAVAALREALGKRVVTGAAGMRFSWRSAMSS